MIGIFLELQLQLNAVAPAFDLRFSVNGCQDITDLVLPVGTAQVLHLRLAALSSRHYIYRNRKTTTSAHESI